MACAILQSILNEPGAIARTTDRARIKTFLMQSFIFAYLWAVGGNIIDSSRIILRGFREEAVRGQRGRTVESQPFHLTIILLRGNITVTAGKVSHFQEFFVRNNLQFIFCIVCFKRLYKKQIERDP